MKRTRYEDDNEEDSFSSESEELFHHRKADENDDNQSPHKKHFCVICNKQFSSGKAYGGHVRIHSIVYGSKGKTKKMKTKVVSLKKEKEVDLIRADVAGKMIRCFLCGKVFQTMHSLFGHMRRHPDRSWKGIRPPHSSLNYDDDDDDGDDDDVISDVTKEVQEAARILMMMSYDLNDYMTMETPNSYVRSSRLCHNDNKGVIVDMEVKMEIDQDEDKRSLGFDLNQPYHDEDHHSSY